MIDRKTVFDTVLTLYDRNPNSRRSESISSVYDMLYDIPPKDGTTFHHQQSEYEQAMGFFHYIPYSPDHFVETIQQLIPFVDAETVKFMDIGCGIGDKVGLAFQLCDIEDCTGLEYNDITIEIARRRIGKKLPVSFIHADGLRFDFSPYNLLYMYHPIANPKNCLELFMRAARTMPVGGVIVEVLPSYIRSYMEDFAEIFDGPVPGRSDRYDVASIWNTRSYAFRKQANGRLVKLDIGGVLQGVYQKGVQPY